MDSRPSARPINRPRNTRKRQTFCPARLEALEERALLSLTLLDGINSVPLFPAEITGAGEKSTS